MKILAIGAHPDDIEIFMYGFLLACKSRGDNISLVVATDGSLGGEKSIDLVNKRFEETKKAEMLFKKISQIRIEEYLMEKKKDVLMSVGSYRIEDNKKYNFLRVLKGDHETIIGFPLKNLKNKFMEDMK